MKKNYPQMVRSRMNVNLGFGWNTGRRYDQRIKNELNNNPATN